MARAYEMLRADPGLNLGQVFRDAVFVNTPRKTVTARNVAQKTYLELLRRHELVFAVGPAGTGKTYLPWPWPVHVSAAPGQTYRVDQAGCGGGRTPGFLPGDLADKVNPYLRPLYDALHDMMPQPRWPPCWKWLY